MAKRKKKASKKAGKRTKKKASKKAFGGYEISFKGQTDSVEKVFGTKGLAPSEMTKKLWSYIKRRKLSNK